MADINVLTQADLDTLWAKMKSYFVKGATTAADGSFAVFDGTTGRNIKPINSIGEGFLSWGGQDKTQYVSPLDCALFPLLGNNLAAFVPASNVTIEYSTDGGTTWLDYGTTDERKTLLFTDRTNNFYIGKYDSSSIDYSNYLLRVTLDTARHIRSSIVKFIIVCGNANSTTGSYCTIEHRTQANKESNTDTWVTVVDKGPVRDYYNTFNVTPFNTYWSGSTKTTIGQIRFTFGVDTYNSSYNSLSTSFITVYGRMAYTSAYMPNNMTRTGHLYSYDYLQNATFPANVTATKFIGPLQGTVNGLTLASKSTGFTISGGTTSKTLTVNQDITLNTAAGHAHSDYVTAVGVSGDTFTYSLGGVAQTPLTIPYATKALNDVNGLPLVKYKTYTGVFAPNDGTLQWYTLLHFNSCYMSKSAIFSISTRRSTAVFTIGFYNYNTPYITCLSYSGTPSGTNGGFTGKLRVISDNANGAIIQGQFYATSAQTGSLRQLGLYVDGMRTDYWEFPETITPDTNTYESFLGEFTATKDSISGYNLMPWTNGTYDIGSSTLAYNNIYGTTLYENGTALASKYLGISAQAVDADKLDGQHGSYYAAASSVTELQGYFTIGVANNALRLSNTSKIGDTNQPVYFTANGVPVSISYTIDKSVPSNAVFTDTATAVDDILHGSNSGTAITYAPYDSRQDKLCLYTGTTKPNGTTPLNVNGYLYATQLYDNGSRVLTSHQNLYSLVIKNSVGTTVLTYDPKTYGGAELTLTKGMVGLGNVVNQTITVTSTSVSDGTNTFNKYVHPTTAGYIHIPSGGDTGQMLIYGGTSGTAAWTDQSNITAGALTTISKTAWGRTYWTANGVPDTISGNMDDVGIITINNGQPITFKTADGNGILRAFVVTSDNNVCVGPFRADETAKTTIYGSEIEFRTKVTGGSELAMKIDSSKNICITNNRGIQWLNASGGSYVNILTVDSSYNVRAGNAGLSLGLYGTDMSFYIGSNIALSIDANKNLTSQGDIVAMGGVAACGIADLNIY